MREEIFVGGWFWFLWPEDIFLLVEGWGPLIKETVLGANEAHRFAEKRDVARWLKLVGCKGSFPIESKHPFVHHFIVQGAHLLLEMHAPTMDKAAVMAATRSHFTPVMPYQLCPINLAMVVVWGDTSVGRCLR